MNRRAFLYRLVAAPVMTYGCWRTWKSEFSGPLNVNLSYEEIISPNKKTVLLIGDSRVRRWRPLPEMVGVQFVRRGLGGERLVDLAERLDRELKYFKPDFLIIQSGINDIVSASLHCSKARDERLELMKSCFYQILQESKKHGAKCLASTVIFPSAAKGFYWVEGVGRISKLVKQFNMEVHDISNILNCQVIDFAETLIEKISSGLTKADFAEDTLHVNQEAYGLLNNLVIDAIDKETVRPR